jgi:predicted nucleic acid-binding protein
MPRHVAPIDLRSIFCVNCSNLKKLLLEPTDDEIEQAWAAFDSGDFADAGIIDQISFIVMRRSGLSQAFTNDRHFRTAGFVPLF